jgi:hypothetical protein
MDVIENHIVDTDKMVEPTTKNDLGVDAVSRADVLNHLANIAKVKAKSDAQKSLMGRCMFMVENMPSVTPISKECIDCIAEDKTFIKMDRIKQLLDSDKIDDMEVLKKIREVVEE